MYEYILKRHVREPVDFLEFGVWRGESILWWADKLSPESRLWGFDSFQGLPEDWNLKNPKGTFSTGGSTPPDTCPNVHYIKGLFEETLASFLRSVSLKSNLLIHMDADLYSSTSYVLRTLGPYIRPGSIVIFDEYWDLKHEFAALENFINHSGKQFNYIAVTRYQAAIQFES